MFCVCVFLRGQRYQKDRHFKIGGADFRENAHVLCRSPVTKLNAVREKVFSMPRQLAILRFYHGKRLQAPFFRFSAYNLHWMQGKDG
jgi:hypothetical protein